MLVKIFYAWQSDCDRKVCYYFIRDAANEAIKQLKSKAEVEDAPTFELELDQDTQGVPGIPKIADTIKLKIADCQIFLADVTHVSSYTTADDRAKHIPNGNVLIELGQALSQKTPERIQLVMNTAFGPFDALPFDLKHHRQPILYNLRDSSDKEQVKTETKKLIGRLKEAIGLMVAKIGEENSRTESLLAANEIAKRRSEAVGIRERFEADVMQNVFLNFRSSLPILAVCLISLESTPVDLSAFPGSKVLSLVPLSGRSWNHAHDGDYFSVFTEKLAADGERISTSLTAINEDGSVFVVDEMSVVATAECLDATGGPKVLSFEQEFSGRTFQSIAKYVKLMRELGIKGAIQANLSLLRVRNFYLVNRHYDSINRPNIFNKATLNTDPQNFPASLDGSSASAVAREMRKISDKVWRAAGAARDPRFDANGDFNFNIGQ